MAILRILPALVLAGVLAAGCASPPEPAPAPDPMSGLALANADAAARGQRITSGVCASCHATGLTGDSPMAAATPFRVIVQRYPLDQLEEAFGEGLVTGHPAMPEFVFRASEIDDLMAYLQTLKDSA
ncbi:c-type cytochrome [Brevundimonas sp. R86498]|uniref:c-type cytochrome n=1 Tax=Brevundimonas sp. R86498 TaxID=3093845 RepID=UPI0037C51666